MMSLADELIAVFQAGIAAPMPDERFNELALRVFAHQFAGNQPYRAFCQARGRTPESVRHWMEIPAVPTAAFKEVPLTTFAPEEAAVVFETSGTTAGGRAGRHYMRTTALYDAALLPPFAAHVLGGVPRMRMLSVGPSSRRSPHSSLGHMLARVIEAFGDAGSAEFAIDGGIDHDGFGRALDEAVRDGTAVCLLGTAFAFVHVLDALAPRRFALPAGSRLMDTGGYKGRAREVPREELLRAYEEVFSISADHVVSEYGMTEMSSQFYATGDCYIGPPWVRTVLVDPESLEPLPETGQRQRRAERGGPAESGLLRHYDLANLDSVMAIQTDDVGTVGSGPGGAPAHSASGDGFRLLGRAVGAEARGCSLAVEELLGQR
jgi:hypothetical protein